MNQIVIPIGIMLSVGFYKGVKPARGTAGKSTLDSC